MLTLAEIFENATPEPNTGCLLWLGPVDQDGYATTGSGRSGRNARRRILGLTDPKIYACHKCDQPGCIEPRHLFAGTSAINQLDSSAKRRSKNSRKTHCPSGHIYDTANTYRPHGGRVRVCRICSRAKTARYLAKKRAAIAKARGGK